MASASNHCERVPYPCGPSAPWRACHAFQDGNTKRGGLDVRHGPTAEHLLRDGPLLCFHVPHTTFFLLPGHGAATEAVQDPVSIESGLSDTSAGTCSLVSPTRGPWPVLPTRFPCARCCCASPQPGPMPLLPLSGSPPSPHCISQQAGQPPGTLASKLSSSCPRPHILRNPNFTAPKSSLDA